MSYQLPKLKWWLWALAVLALATLVAKSTTAPVPRKPNVSVAAPVTPGVYYIAATATGSDGWTSGYSNEVIWTNNFGTNIVGLAWDAPDTSEPITNYTLWWGPASRVYTNHADAGTNLLWWLAIWNRMVAVEAQESASAQGPWRSVTNWSPLVLTNPSANVFLKLNISNWNQ